MSDSLKREKEYLQNFKKMIRDMLFLLRTSLQADTVSMHWINERRDLLVLENYTTDQKNVVFNDRVERKSYYLGKYDSIKSVTRLEVGIHISTDELRHYTSTPSVRYIYLIPFKYNSQTVAVTSVESSGKSQLTESDEEAITAYEKAQHRLLQTYLELSDLSEKQSQWIDYEEVAQELAKIGAPLELAMELLEELQHFTGQNGGALLLARGMKDWHLVLYSEKANYPPPIGLSVQEGSISEQALTSGKSLFTTHFNANPKRISTQEPLCNGATLAVPIMHQQRRQMLVLVYNDNPLIFTEAVKHKINNLCRIAGLKVETMLPNLDVHEDIFATGLSSYKQDLFKGCLSTLLQHREDYNGTKQTWVGMVSIGNIADLRTKYRLDDLIELQQQVLLLLRPQHYGLTGILGEYSDYVYTFILQSADEAAFTHWSGAVMEKLRFPVDFSSGNKEEIMLNIGYSRVDRQTEADTVMQVVKKAMNEAVKNRMFKVEA